MRLRTPHDGHPMCLACHAATLLPGMRALAEEKHRALESIVEDEQLPPGLNDWVALLDEMRDLGLHVPELPYATFC